MAGGNSSSGHGSIKLLRESRIQVICIYFLFCLLSDYDADRG